MEHKSPIVNWAQSVWSSPFQAWSRATRVRRATRRRASTAASAAPSSAPSCAGAPRTSSDTSARNVSHVSFVINNYVHVSTFIRICRKLFFSIFSFSAGFKLNLHLKRISADYRLNKKLQSISGHILQPEIGRSIVLEQLVFLYLPWFPFKLLLIRISALSDMDEKRPVRFDGGLFLSFMNKIDRLWVCI